MNSVGINLENIFDQTDTSIRNDVLRMIVEVITDSLVATFTLILWSNSTSTKRSYLQLLIFWRMR